MKILEEINDDQCTPDTCPEKSGVVFSYIALMCYMIVVNVLLLNLLIAMFRLGLNINFRIKLTDLALFISIFLKLHISTR